MISSKKNELIIYGTNFTLNEVKKHFKIEEEWPDEEDTVSYFIIEKMDKIPYAGEKINEYGLIWEILEMKSNSISKVKLKKA